MYTPHYVLVWWHLRYFLLYFRAKFSEITKQSIERALQTLGEPDKAMSDAVDVRSELDLRIGTNSYNQDYLLIKITVKS